MPMLPPVALIGRPKSLFARIEEIEPPKSIDQLIDETPTQGAVKDALKRSGRSMVDQPGAVVESGGTVLDLMERALRAYGAGQPENMIAQAFLPEDQREKPVKPAEAMTRELKRPSVVARVVQDTGRQMRKDAGELYTGDFAPDPARDRTLPAQVADSVGPLAASVATPGGVVAKTITGALLNSQGAADDAERILIEKGSSPEEARDEAARQFVLNLPAGALESVAWGKLLGRYGKSLENAVSEKWGKDALTRILKATGEQAVIEGGEEVLQQGVQNVAAKATYDPKRKVSAGMKEAGLVGAVMGGGLASTVQTGAEVADKLDTGRNTPERPEDLRAQQKQLVTGDRAVQMFPLGTDELALPKGMERVETPRGIFHYDPRRMTADEILSASQAGRENELLGLGPHSKAEVEQRAKAGEPMATIVERGPGGEELRGAAVTPSTQAATREAMEAGKSAGSTVDIERMEDTLKKRQPAKTTSLDEMINQAANEQQERTAEVEKENRDREDRQQAAREKREKFAFHLGNAQRVAAGVAASGQPAVAEVVGSANVLRDYVQDNTLGLTLDQKLQASELLAQLEPVEARLKADAEAKTQARLDEEKRQRAEAEAEQKKRIATERRQIAQQDAAGIGTSGQFEYGVATASQLEERAAQGDERAGKELMRREDRAAVEKNATLDYTLRDLILGKKEAMRAAGRREPLLLLSPKVARERGSLGGEHAALADRAAGFKYFSDNGVAEDDLQEQLAELGFDAPDVKTAYELWERAVAGEEIKPIRGMQEQVEFATAETAEMPTPPTQPKDWRGPEAKQYMKDLQGYQAQLAEWTKDTPDVLPFRQRGDGNEAGVALVSRNMNGGQPWRLTFFKDKKPVAHHEFGSKLDAVRAALAQHGPAPEIEFARVEETNGSEHAGPTLASIEAKMMRGGIERDTAARAVNRYIDVLEGKGKWPNRMETTKQGRRVETNLVDKSITDSEARALHMAVKEYDQGGRFDWPDEGLRDRVMMNFAQAETERLPASDREASMTVTEFEARLRRIAPGLMMRYKVLVGEPDLMLQMGVRPDQLTGREQAAHFPRRKALWFLARNVRADKSGLMDERLRRDVLHETTHAWLDSQDADMQDELRQRWAGDVERDNPAGNGTEAMPRPGGWLATMRQQKVKLRKGVETDWKEYWAERIAQENNQWAARREGAVAGERGFVSQLAYDFRQWLQEALEYLQAAFTRTKRYNVDFRAFLQNPSLSQSRSPEPYAGPASAAPAPLPLAAAQGEGVSFAMEESPADRQAALVRQYNHLTREINAAAGKGNMPRLRNMQGHRSEIRAQLDDDFPNWRKEHPEGPDGLRREKPAQKDNVEPEPDAVEPPEQEFATRPGIHDEVKGHTTVRVPWHERTWEYMKDTFYGLRGSIPELPPFADDRDQKYNRLRMFSKLIKRGTPRVWKEATDQLGTIVKPLLDAGKLDANAYARLGHLKAKARQLNEENRQIPEGMREEIADLNRAVEREPYGLFQNIALYLDLKWRVENLKDEQGNAIAQPSGMNAKEINDEIGRMKEHLSSSPHRAAILTALREHQAMVKEIAADLRARDLTMPEEMQNPFYYPHIVLAKGRDTLERVKLDTQEDFRAYLLRPVGSTKPIETDYTKAMYYHLVAVGSHNLRSDLVKDYVKPYDIMAEVRERAKELGKQYGRPVSWREAFATEYAKDGFVTFHPDDQLPLHPEMTVDRDTLARRLGVVLTEEPLQQQLEAMGLKGIKLLPQDIKEALAAGEKETWILPEKVAEALHGMLRRESQTTDSLISKPIQLLQAGWKRNILFAPWNYPRYEFNNTVADLEKLLSADPEVYRLLPKAAKEVRQFIEEGKGGRDVHEAFKRGVLDSITAAEINDLTALKQFEKMQTDRQKWTGQALRRLSSLVFQPLGAGNRSTLDLSRLREATFRYAKFKADLDRLRNGARPVYAGAYWRDIDAIEDSRKGAGDANYQKAAEISLATFGDYHNISVAGQELRRYLIPFYSWMEINFKYHANLLRNLKDMTLASEMSAADAAKAGARAAAVAAATFTRKAAGGVLLRLALPYLAVMLWNNSGDRDELEDGLSAEDKRRFHIILGKDASGKTMVVYGQTAFADVAKWFGGMDAMRLAGDIAGGKTDFSTAMGDWLKKMPRDFLNNIWQVGPAVKVAYTAMSGKSSFPDVTDQRTIPANDVKWHILGQATDQTVAEIIRRAADKDYLSPRDMKDWAQQAILQVRKRDPQQWAFYEIKDKAAAFLEAETGQSRDSSYNAPDQQVLRNFRRAIYKGDVENAMRFYDRLLELGYTAERFKASVRAQDPLSALPKDLRDDFVKSLSRFERAQLTRAYVFYARMAEIRGAERAIFPTNNLTERQRLQYRPRHERLLEEMQNTDRMTDEEVNLKAEKELRRSVRPSMR